MYKKLLSFLMILTLLLTAVSFAEAPAPGSAVIGEGTAQGFGGPIGVDLAVVDGQIIAADIIGYGETEGIGQKIVDEWPQAFVDANGIIDTYSGATFAYVTRAAVIEAARAALTEAGLSPDDYMRQAEEKQAEDFEEIPPQEFELSDPMLDAVEKDDKFIIIVKRATIYVLPKRCMSSGEQELVREKLIKVGDGQH